MNWDADEFLKTKKNQQTFGIGWGDRKLCVCGRTIYPHPLDPDSSEYRQGETEIYENRCNICRTEQIAAYEAFARGIAPKPEKKKPPLCRWCWKKRKLVGAWCRTCRNKYQRRRINEALEKIIKGQSLSWEDELTLEFAPQWPFWNREFKKKFKDITIPKSRTRP